MLPARVSRAPVYCPALGTCAKLLNVLRQAVVLSPDGIVTAEHIRFNDHLANGGVHNHPYMAVPAVATPDTIGIQSGAPQTIAEAGARHISDLLQRHDHDRRIVANVLGISERTLYRKIKRYRIFSPSALVEWRWSRGKTRPALRQWRLHRPDGEQNEMKNAESGV